MKRMLAGLVRALTHMKRVVTKCFDFDRLSKSWREKDACLFWIVEGALETHRARSRRETGPPLLRVCDVSARPPLAASITSNCTVDL